MVEVGYTTLCQYLWPYQPQASIDTSPINFAEMQL